jgi:hypothetical protein
MDDIDIMITALEPGTHTLVIAEGGNDVLLFRRLADDLGLPNVQVGAVKGQTEFARKLPTIITFPGFEDAIKSIGVVRDANSDPKRAFDQVCSALREAHLPIPTAPDIPAVGPPKVTVHLLPGRKRSGVLETLCLEAVRDNPHYACVEAYFECLQTEGIAIPAHKLAKAKAHAYLASCRDPVAGVGVGFKHSKDYWNLSSPVWDPARQFLCLIVEPHPLSPEAPAPAGIA